MIAFLHGQRRRDGIQYKADLVRNHYDDGEFKEDGYFFVASLECLQ
jgi:hypothetical protein